MLYYSPYLVDIITTLLVLLYSVASLNKTSQNDRRYTNLTGHIKNLAGL